jgi:hypothetical protein
MSTKRKNGKWGQRIGLGIAIPKPLPLSLMVRLLDWCVECEDGYETPCWTWQGYTDLDGYPEMKWRGKKFRTARVAFVAFGGYLKDGEDVDHRCQNRTCVNPDHLQATDHFTNCVTLRNQRREAVPI